MASFEKGYTFTSNEQVTAAKLHALIANALLLPGAISDKTEKTTAGADDFFLVWDSADATLKKVKHSAVSPTYAVLGATRDLVIKSNSGAPTTSLDITCAEALLKNSSNQPLLATAISVTAVNSASGVNGLDTGSLNVDTWYYVWLISNGTTHASLLSASATAPTLPGGYTHKALVGAVPRIGSSFLRIYQSNRTAWCAHNLIFTGQAGTNGVDAAVAFTLAAPPIARAVSGIAGVSSSSTGTFMIGLGSDANYVGGALITVTGQATSAEDGFWGAAPFRICLPSGGGNIVWKGQGNGTVYRIVTTGWEL